jgi:CheY-like chemotaxis protein
MKIRSIDESFSMKCCNDVLIIDDAPFNVMSLELILLQCFEIPCDKAFSAKEALKLIDQRKEKVH